jgi:peptide/nickel transport system ATP-binding protein
MTEPLLNVESLSVCFPTSKGLVHAVHDLSFEVAASETIAIVGESGSGKSTAALALNRLLPRGSQAVVKGSIRFNGSDLATVPDGDMRHLRGRDIGMIFQDTGSTLNPVFSIGAQIMQPLRLHNGLDRQAAAKQAIELLRLVRIPAPETRLRQYPHNLSGGMRQRVMIAIALACRPKLLIADEPTTALDVTVQAQILQLIVDLRAEFGMAVLLITHDLGVVWEMADRVIVMYAGRKVEEGPVKEVLTRPAHPYTAGLLRAAQKQGEGRRLAEIPGIVPAPQSMLPGCAFAPRCTYASEACRSGQPAFRSITASRSSACIHPLVEETRS